LPEELAFELHSEPWVVYEWWPMRKERRALWVEVTALKKPFSCRLQSSGCTHWASTNILVLESSCQPVTLNPFHYPFLFISLFFFFFNWSMVDLQFCASLCCTAKWQLCTYIHSFLYSCPLYFIKGYRV